MNGNDVVKRLTNGELHKFKRVVILSGNGYTTILDVEQVHLIIVYASGMIYVEEAEGNCAYYRGADMFLKQE
jgi:hypothetical protein